MENNMKKAVVTGVTGQDGAYLAALLLEKGYKVYGACRRTSAVNYWRMEHPGGVQHPNLELIDYDLTDSMDAMRLLEASEAEEVYNLAAQSFVGVSFKQPMATSQITGLGALNLLEAIKRQHQRCLGKFRMFLRKRTHLFIQEAHTASQSYMLTG
jgi:GDPmannose 4,6-dehydratase